MESVRKAAGENEGGVMEKPQESLTSACMCAFKCALSAERCDKTYDQTRRRAILDVLSGFMTDSGNKWTLKHACFVTELSKLYSSTFFLWFHSSIALTSTLSLWASN